MATKVNELHFYTDPGGGSGDHATIKYLVSSGESTKLTIEVTNDADDRITLQTPGCTYEVRQFPLFDSSGYMFIRGNTGYYYGGQTGVIITSPSGSFRQDWPSGWGGGLATFDIVCASIKTAAGIVTSSDKNIKENIKYLDSGLNVIRQLQPVSYFWKKEHNPYEYARQQYGFIAQDVEKIIPELVIPGSYDEINKKEGIRSLNYTAIIPFLTKAIQEQQDKIELQQKTIESLEARLKVLEDLLK